MKLLLHAPTPAALERARRNAANARRDRPNLQIAIIVNGGAVAAALDTADPRGTDPMLVYCENTLKGLGRHPPHGARTVPAAILALVDWQADGWTYVRA
jgi:NitT/TauT family transport system ATP-binding protein